MTCNTCLHPDLLTACEEYISVAGIAESTFGQKAMRERRFVQQLRDGRHVRPHIRERLLNWMASNPPKVSA